MESFLTVAPSLSGIQLTAVEATTSNRVVMPKSSCRLLRKTRHDRYPVPEWVGQQMYLHLYPKELVLRNHI